MGPVIPDVMTEVVLTLFGAPTAIGMREQPLPPGESFAIVLPPHSVSLLKIDAQ